MRVRKTADDDICGFGATPVRSWAPDGSGGSSEPRRDCTLLVGFSGLQNAFKKHVNSTSGFLAKSEVVFLCYSEAHKRASRAVLPSHSEGPG